MPCEPATLIGKVAEFTVNSSRLALNIPSPQRYMFSIMRVANSLVLALVAPSIWRSKS